MDGRTAGATGPAADTPEPAISPARADLRFTIAFCAAVAVALGAALLTLDRAGVGSRRAPAGRARVVVVDDATGLVRAWDGSGLEGVHLVEVTRDLGYAFPPLAAGGQRVSGWPVSLRDRRDLLRDATSRASRVWVAAKTGIARTVTYVLEPTDLTSAVARGRRMGWPGIAPDGRSVLANDDGYLRRIGARFPGGATGPIALDIDASYFVEGTPEALMRDIERSGIDPRLITLDRASDAKDVPAAARARLDAMAALLREWSRR